VQFQYQLNIIKILPAIILIQFLVGNPIDNNDENISTSVDSLYIIEKKFLEIRESILHSVSADNPNGEIEMLIRLYDINKRSNAREHQFLTQALGKIGDNKVIPMLMEIAHNHDLPVSIRGSAVEVLSKKQAPELVDFVVEMLGNPESRDKVNEFALDVMGDLSEERMILALLESYRLGRSKYYSLLNTVMNSLDNFENPEILSVYKEIAHTKDFPAKIRLKAFKGLVRFSNDPVTIDHIIELLNDPDNYIYYEEIIALLQDNGVYENYKTQLRMAAYKAMQNESAPFGILNE